MSYVFGSISSAIIVCRLAGLDDPRSKGSKNPGATNVLRLGGKKYALLTLTGDVLKGVIPVLIAKHLELSELTIALTMLFAFLGHLYPVFFGFIGGKGVATAFGVIFAAYWVLGAISLLIWLVIAAIFRYSSLAGLVAFILAAPISVWLGLNNYISISLLIISLFQIYRHQDNIQKLIQGKESKIGKK